MSQPGPASPSAAKSVTVFGPLEVLSGKFRLMPRKEECEALQGSCGRYSGNSDRRQFALRAKLVTCVQR